jgi:excisionase family DNA binding protein
MDDILTVQEVADYLKIDYATIWRLCNAGTLRAFRVGQVWRIERADVDRLIGRRPAPGAGRQRAGNRAPVRPRHNRASGNKP